MEALDVQCSTVDLLARLGHPYDTIVLPDFGGLSRLQKNTKNVAYCLKRRGSGGVECKLVGSVKGKSILIYDDIADSCATLFACLAECNDALTIDILVSYYCGSLDNLCRLSAKVRKLHLGMLSDQGEFAFPENVIKLL